MDCKGVKEVMGHPRSVDLVSPMALGILTSTTGDEGGVDLLDSGGVPGLLSVSVSGFSICKASSFCEDLSVSCGISSGLNLSCAYFLKLGLFFLRKGDCFSFQYFGKTTPSMLLEGLKTSLQV